MKLKLIISLVVLAITSMAQERPTPTPTPTQQKGPRGGCYIVVKSKRSGKEYKKYQPCKGVR